MNPKEFNELGCDDVIDVKFVGHCKVVGRISDDSLKSEHRVVINQTTGEWQIVKYTQVLQVISRSMDYGK